MRVSLPSLASHLEQEVGPLYVLFGNETLLVEETLDRIRHHARQAGYTERIRLHVEPGFDWSQLMQQGQSMSLFADKRLMELRLPTGKPGDEGSKALIQYTANMNPDTALIVISGPIEKRSQNSKWFKALDTAGVVIESPAVSADRLPEWISQRMTAMNLRFEPEAVSKLADFVEGNLLAADQEIKLLALLYPEEIITLEIIDQVIADHARFNVFNFVDACLAGSVNRVTRILQSLRREQVEPVLVVWALARETRTLCRLSAAADKGQRPQGLMRKFGIWSNRTGIVTAALQRLNKQQWETLLRRIGRADLMLKGRAPMQRKDIWEEIESICLAMCGLKIR